MKIFFVTSLLVFTSFLGYSQENNTIHHVLNVQINPKTSAIVVLDSVFITNVEELEFSLNEALIPSYFSKNIKAEQIAADASANDVGMDRDNDDEDDKGLKLNKWALKIKKESGFFVIKYDGIIASPIEQSEENYQRGFSESPGIISDLGIYLAGSTHWVPSFGEALVTFKLTTVLPEDWKVVTQGERIAESVSNGKHSDTWLNKTPQEEVFLIGARFNEYSYTMNSGIEAMAFLRTPDESIANRYLEVTDQYMNMYQGLIGPYPYTKFALVENFWETGYGMPSFTLLGEKIIRFPFILHSSYPHELLHNWWGNGVYVDFTTGNWCEGLTAYMADHLIKEQRGQGEAYRRSTLQKFSNVVTKNNDFPLDKFISRHDAPSEAIGYGKSLMMWHMLRRRLGDDYFKQTMVRFYKNHEFKVSSFDDIRMAADSVSNSDLQAFFTQWLTRTGAPEIAIKKVNVSKYNTQYRVSLTLEQKQEADAFSVDIPITIATSESLETFIVNLTQKEQDFQFMIIDKPLKLVVDPQYDVFRILHPREVPPAWSKILASEKNLVVLPSLANDVTKQLYKDFIEAWQVSDNDDFEVVFDNEISAIPSDRTTWVLGFDNKFATDINTAIKNYNSAFVADSVIFENKSVVKKNHSFVLTVFNDQNLDVNVSFIAFDNPNSIPGLIRKLPHYGKYSYLGFEGDEPTNVAKGQWPVFNSPMESVFDPAGQFINVNEPRQALAALPPVFSENRMMKSIEYLASEELKGRGLGTPELDEAADYIANKFKEYGLEPMGESYFQKFTHTFPDKGEMKMKNVVAIIRGTDAELKASPVVLSAHYDHLGLGWPDVRKGNEGKIHYGADDNASGVSIMLELAKALGSTMKPKRTVIFVAFTGEEAGLIGSRYFVSQIKKYYNGDIIADVNIDTDGHLFDNKLMIINGNSAKEWKFVFMGTDYTTGIKTDVITQELDASDQVAFIEKGIPAVQFFTGPNEYYHRPTDTYDKIDGPGLVKVATVTKEVIAYLADRDTPFEFTGKVKFSLDKTSTKPKTVRKASTGSVPDFAFSGAGVRISSVIEDSPAEKAGLKTGDVITALNNDKVIDLKAYSDALKKYQPGDVVKIKIIRDNKEMEVTLTLGER